MYYITLDLEWNQAYAQKAEAVQRRLACRLRGEVIQIGAVKLDERMVVCGSYSVIIRPKYFQKIHRHVSELTGISQQQMDRGLPLPEAAENFRKWCGKDFAFLTWGPDDIPMLKTNLKIHDMDTDWLSRTYDLQAIFNRQNNDGSKQRSLEYAMDFYELKQTLPAHDALNDAFFTALVAQKLDVKEGIRTYGDARGNDLSVGVFGNADDGDDGYVTVGELLEDESVVCPPCPLCGGALIAEDKPLHSQGQHYQYLYRCKKDGLFFLHLKLHRNYNGTFRARRVVNIVTDESLADFRKKQEEAAAFKKTRNRRSHHRGTRKPTVSVGAGKNVQTEKENEFQS